MVVHPASVRITRVRTYSGYLYRACRFSLRGYYPVSPPFPGVVRVCVHAQMLRSHNPPHHLGSDAACGIVHAVLRIIITPKVVRGLGCSRFARRYYGNLV